MLAGVQHHGKTTDEDAELASGYLTSEKKKRQRASGCD